MEELLLKTLFTFEELNVIYQKYIHVSVDFLEFASSVCSDCINKLIEESFGGHIDNSLDWMTLIVHVVTLDVVANRLE